MNQRRGGSFSRRSVLQSVGAAAFTGLSRSVSAGSALAARRAPHHVSNGYADRLSYRPGDEVSLFLSGASGGKTALALDAYGSGPTFRFWSDLYPQEPAGSTPWETGFGYRESAFFRLPSSFRSGVYLVDHLVPVIVKADRNAAPPADITIVYPTNTMAAYNEAGGRSMYTSPKAPIVSFLRPVGPISNLAFFSAFLEWFATPPAPPVPYSIRYVADIDLEDYGEIAGSKLLMLIGHSEYWTRQARENFDQFVLEGGNALVLSGNTMWWQVRYGGNETQLICYKGEADPVSDSLLRTVNWTNPKLEYPPTSSLGTDFVHGGFGDETPGAKTGFRILAPQSPVFRGLRVAAGDLLEIPTLEYDGAPLLNDPPTVGEPRLDLAALDAYRAEIIGYEYCVRDDTEAAVSAPPGNVATWLAYQRSSSSGMIINGASTNWCSRTGAFGVDGFRVRQVIVNMIEILMRGESPFSS